jgi:hypothetical protein
MAAILECSPSPRSQPRKARMSCWYRAGRFWHAGAPEVPPCSRAAWAYRHPPRVGREKQAKVAAAPRRVREIAGKAQTLLCRRFRFLERKGNRRTVVATAVTRELAAFIWAINREVMQGRQA